MLFYISLSIFLLFVIIVYIFYINKREKYNIMEDMPTLNIEKNQLERHAEEISNFYSESRKMMYSKKLMKSLDESYKHILEDYYYLDEDSKNKIEIVPAGEWLLDNLYLIEKEYKDIKRSMPKKYYKDLPIVKKGIMKGYPRVYYIAVEIASHTNGKIDGEVIENFVNVYQKRSVLTTGELWALPIMLRIALIQNISAITSKIIFTQKEAKRADKIADKLIEASNNNSVDKTIKTLIDKNIKFTPQFIEKLLTILRDNAVEDINIYKWIDRELEIKEIDEENVINQEHKNQSIFQISIGNYINSIRNIQALNWKNNFEKLSYVEKILSKDPAKVYNKMDFESRDYYRHKLEKLSKQINIPETFIAKKAIECAEEAEVKDNKSYVKHVGYYIIDKGIECLKEKIGIKENLLNKVLKNISKNRANYYVASIVIATLLFILGMIFYSVRLDSNFKLYNYVILAIVIFIPCSEIIISIFHWSINSLTEPTFISKVEYFKEIPEEYSSMVVISTLINNEDSVRKLVKDLEVYYLANPQKNIYYGILGDFKDSNTKELENDNKIINTALNEIKKLNKKYSNDKEDIFYFFNRYRQYNEKEKAWIGWERKRGKLMEFNSLIRGYKNTSYNVISGNVDNLSKIKYIITLDADTQLPKDSAKKLIGAMSHILNIPYVDKENKKVLRGYGLLQPRISVGNLSANKTLFSKIFSGETGLDVYTTAISDVYQDLFGEGIFTGKGIYDVDVFNNILKDEIPENTVLSHDLLEGSYVKAGLVTDIELIDGYPAYYNSSCKRLHRWVRGDWQLLPWITNKTKLNTLSKWKIIDNMRRSLLAPSLIILLLLAFMLPNTDIWLTLSFIAILVPILFDVSDVVVLPQKGIGASGKINNWKINLKQLFLIFCFLPHQAYLMLDAIFRSLYRIYKSKKNLLQWQTAADAELTSGKELKDYIKFMYISIIISILVIYLALNKSTNVTFIMIPSCLLWAFSPFIAFYISKDLHIKRYIKEEDKLMLRKLSRKIWAYFEDFINEDSNWLAPDNYQENPNNGIAHRTSPTNIGMGLTANICAYDLGYIEILDLIFRLENILVSMEDLEKYKGHFYNWYNTNTKKPLYPRYVSTVDSGNLVGYLWLVSESLKKYMKTPIFNKKEGLIDLLCLANDSISEKLEKNNIYSSLIYRIRNIELNPLNLKILLQDILLKANKINNEKSLYWNNKVIKTSEKFLKNLNYILPWIDMVEESPKNLRDNFMKFALNFFNVPIKKLPYIIERFIKEINEYNDSYVLEFKSKLNVSKNEIEKIINKIDKLIKSLNSIADDTDFSILYDSVRQLFYIGYDVENNCLTKSYYDLIASESRQASFIAIAKGDIEKNHWFKLGRAITKIKNGKALISWSGTMFEYFMPLLIMKNYTGTLWDETYKSIIREQKRYCENKKIPWGISESAFYDFDLNSNYQYKAFGIPTIGLKRGLINELVISPYSTILAMQVDLEGGIKNIRELKEKGIEGKYGFYEAVDYTTERIPKGKKAAIVKNYMVHHKGMSLMALDNILNNNVLQNRFHSIPKVKSVELLLQERVPNIVVYDREERIQRGSIKNEKYNIIVRKYINAKTDIPEVQLLSNGSYSLMISNRGTGYAKRDNLNLYRWKENSTNDNKGMFFYIKNLNSNEYWSTTYEPCKNEGENYEVTFSLDKANFKRKDGNLITEMDTIVTSDDDAEIRKISITNKSSYSRTIEVTSYCELTLASYNADLVHPAFSNLFINTEFIGNPFCILANRRPRSIKDKNVWIMQTVTSDTESLGRIEYETNRENFIGRCRDLSNPQAMENEAPLKNTVGSVLDPIISIRIRFKIEPGKTCNIAYTTAVGNSKEEVIELANKYSKKENINRALNLLNTSTKLNMKYLGIKSAQANLYQSMASKILYLNSSFNYREEFIKNMKLNQQDLWSYGVSGDLPIVLLIIDNEKCIQIFRQLLKAYEYWNSRGLQVDLVVINLNNEGYVQNLQDKIRDLIYTSYARDKVGKNGGVFVINNLPKNDECINLFIAISRLVFFSSKGTLLSQLNISNDKNSYNKKLLENKKIELINKPYEISIPELEYFNTFGGFNLKNNSYIIILENYNNTPAPWINVISNGNFGFHVSENGVSYTWNKNSRENKITNWSNDPVLDDEAEEIYIRDEETGDVWSVSPKPIRDNGRYVIEHGFGYSIFKHQYNGILGEMVMFVPLKESVKFCSIKLKNNSNKERKLSLTYYARLVMGVVPENSAQYISTYLDKDKEYIYAKNLYNRPFKNLITYLSCIGCKSKSFTGDRKEFLGIGGSVVSPEVLKYESLSNNVGAGFDPCLALNGKLEIKPNEEKIIVFMLGEEERIESIESVIKKYKNIKSISNELINVKNYWKKLLSTIQIKTPDKSMDIMVNGWLMYQVISCRFWSRTAFYQSGGAYGFRDQLQDVIPITYLDANITREHILYSASRQFKEGDVQHWWHPIVESGIRTRFSDDLLWLPYTVINYINITEDYSILYEKISYLEDEPLKTGEDERYTISRVSKEKESLYHHCIKAIERAAKFGEHNIPLMGSGDWNDGMSTVGNKGRGESVWLGWFLYTILEGFSEICIKMQDKNRANNYSKLKEFIRENLEKNAWDGGWYRRAYFDNGTPLGSIENEECQIDSLSQSWSVISNAGKKSRQKIAMEALEKYLIKENKGMIKLLTPAFHKSSMEPGYIKGYVPGVRENGGQYTHAAIWTIIAFAKLGCRDKAWKMFNMINPINHTKSNLECEIYKIEPYVMSADVYAREPHTGRGGWSWYTGSAGWMYRAAIEDILGLKIIGSKGIKIVPCIPNDWQEYYIYYEKENCKYNIHVMRSENKYIEMDNNKLEGDLIPFKKGEHNIKVLI
ncbi:N,N'-diacetylchitobiose phosphorylase [Clostridium acetireducens DSM 10703]|uniref:N,N'-diacetylchitobiose phosphorylase n=1 Tax=Clostridium acetireducens DSM 10703 TaxID=1121290 RepID=A0A1E8F1H8_9CLOT|nr:glucoamylase family protein [Clostridium acetireducens]OFI07442.1 N,N'-diacetylchitobiose phosphorylase [Clostridium acetireducens DSM 10703]